MTTIIVPGRRTAQLTRTMTHAILLEFVRGYYEWWGEWLAFEYF